MNAETAWAMYYAGILAFQYHPANPSKQRLSTSQCAAFADEALLEHHKRFPEVIDIEDQEQN